MSDDGKIYKDSIIPEEVTKPSDNKITMTLPELEGLTTHSLEELKKINRAKENPDFKTPIFDVNPKILGLKDILDQDGRRHIKIRDINRGKILDIKDL